MVSIGRETANFVGRRGGYGNLVEIHHGNSYRTRYAHFSQIASGHREGKQVVRGKVIGPVGRRGMQRVPTGISRCCARERTSISWPYVAQGDDLIEFTGLCDAHLALLGQWESWIGSVGLVIVVDPPVAARSESWYASCS